MQPVGDFVDQHPGLIGMENGLLGAAFSESSAK
jgi:hypothetical protein